MRLDSRSKEKPAGVVFDTGTQKRIPFVIWCDFDTGEYEAYQSAPNGIDIQADRYGVNPVKYKGKAVGKLTLIPYGRAKTLLPEAPQSSVIKIDKKGGLEMHKEVCFKVWELRGIPKQERVDKFADYVKKSRFLDDLLLPHLLKEKK